MTDPAAVQALIDGYALPRLSSSLYKAARIVNTVSRPTPRRAKNIAVGRLLARGGFWRRLWGGGR